MASDPPKVLISYSQDSPDTEIAFWYSPAPPQGRYRFAQSTNMLVMPTEGWPYAPVVAVATRKPSGTRSRIVPSRCFAGD
jgi:hypothetical protein